MANEERVVLVAEVRDEATADLDNINRSVDNTKKKVDDAAKSTDKSTRGMTSAFDRFSSGGSKAFQRFSGSMKSGLDRGTQALGGLRDRIAQSDGMFGRFVRTGTRGLQDFASGFRSPMAAASSFTGRLGTIGGVVKRGANALGGIGRALQPAVSMAGNVVSSVGRVAGSALKAGGAIASNVVSALGTAAKRAGQVSAVLGGIVIADALRGGVSRAMRLDEAEARMRGMGYEAAEIDTLMDNASDAIMGTSFTLDDAATAAQQLSAAGVEAGDDMENVIGVIGDSAFVAGTEFNEMGDIWAQVAARGSLDGQIMNRMLSNGIEITDGLAEQMGVTGDEIQDMISAGEVGFEDFAAAMTTQFGGAAQEASTTMSGAFANVRSGLHMISAEVVGPFMETFRGAFVYLQEPIFALSEVISPVFNALTENVTEWSDTALVAGEDAADGIRKFVEPMEEVADHIRDGKGLLESFQEVFGDFDGEDSPLGFLSDVGSVASDLSPIMGIIKGLGEAGGEAFGAIFDTLQELAPMVGDIFASLGAAIAPLLGTVLTVVADLITQLMPVITQIVGVIADVIEQLAPIIGDVLAVVAEVIGEIITTLVPVIVPLIEMIGDALIQLVPVALQLFEALMPIIEVVVDLAATLITALTPILGTLIDAFLMIVDVALEIVVAFLPFVDVILDLAMSIIQSLLPVFVALVPVIVPLVEILLELLMIVLEPLIGIVVWLAEVIADFLIANLDTLVPIVVGVLDVLAWLAEFLVDVLAGDVEWVNDILEWFADAWDNVVTAAVGAWEWLEPIIEQIVETATTMWEETIQPIFQGFADAWGWVSDSANTLWEEVLSPFFTWFGDTANWLWDEIVNPIFTWISDKFSDLGDTFSYIWNEFISPALSAFSDFFDETLIPAIQTGVDKIGEIWDTVQNLFAKPINWVIGTVINGGLIGAFNRVAGFVPGVSELDPLPEIETRAKGGPVRAGQPYLVGEEGPELITPSSSGMVHTADETRAMLSGGTEGVMPMGGGNRGSIMGSSLDDRIEGREDSQSTGGAFDWARGKLVDGVEWLLEKPFNALDSWAENRGHMAQVMAGTAINIRDEILSWARGEDDAAVASGSYDGEFTANPGGFNRPMAGMISSMAGRRAYSGRYGNMHYGVDIANSVGSAVRAAWSGVVKSVAGAGMDQAMVLNHGSYDTAYMHNSEILASPGTEVTGGEIIARSGTAGSGPHLHFEYHPNGYYDPSILGVNALFDDGGVLGTGTTIAQNNTGHPEFVLTNQRFGQVEDALDYVAATLPMVTRGGDSGGTATMERGNTVTIEEGAVQVNIDGVGGDITSPEVLDQLKEAIEEIFEESARRDY